MCQLRKTGEYFSPSGGKSLWKGLEFDQERPQHSRTVRGRATPGWSGANPHEFSQQQATGKLTNLPPLPDQAEGGPEQAGSGTKGCTGAGKWGRSREVTKMTSRTGTISVFSEEPMMRQTPSYGWRFSWSPASEAGAAAGDAEARRSARALPTPP